VLHLRRRSRFYKGSDIKAPSHHEHRHMFGKPTAYAQQDDRNRKTAALEDRQQDGGPSTSHPSLSCRG
jgi:hypothetical protein